MPKLTVTVLVVAIAIMALLWLYTQPDEMPEFPRPAGDSASSETPSGSGQLPPAAHLPQTNAPRAADPGALTTDSPEPDPAAEVAALGAQNTDETAIPITPGFEDLLEPSPRTRERSASMTLEKHRSLLAEARDEEWAERIESDFRTFIESRLSAQGLDVHRIELPVIECRTTLCEVQATGAAADANTSLNVQSLAALMVKGPLAADFSGSSAETFGLPDGRVGYLVFLMRHRSP